MAEVKPPVPGKIMTVGIGKGETPATLLDWAEHPTSGFPVLLFALYGVHREVIQKKVGGREKLAFAFKSGNNTYYIQGIQRYAIPRIESDPILASLSPRARRFGRRFLLALIESPGYLFIGPPGERGEELALEYASRVYGRPFFPSDKDRLFKGKYPMRSGTVAYIL